MNVYHYKSNTNHLLIYLLQLLGLTCIELAVINNNQYDVESFVMRGADVNSYDSEGHTALLYAAERLSRACLHKQVSLIN